MAVAPATACSPGSSGAGSGGGGGGKGAGDGDDDDDACDDEKCPPPPGNRHPSSSGPQASARATWRREGWPLNKTGRWAGLRIGTRSMSGGRPCRVAVGDLGDGDEDGDDGDGAGEGGDDGDDEDEDDEKSPPGPIRLYPRLPGARWPLLLPPPPWLTYLARLYTRTEPRLRTIPVRFSGLRRCPKTAEVTQSMPTSLRTAATHSVRAEVRRMAYSSHTWPGTASSEATQGGREREHVVVAGIVSRHRKNTDNRFK